MTKTYMILAIVALLLGASAGIFLTVRHFLRKKLPAIVALLHGVGGATGFALVLVAVVQAPEYVFTRQALYILIAAIALGCVNLLFHVRKKRHRTSLIALHAFTAVAGVVTLLYGVFTYPAPVPVAQAKPAPTVAPSAPAPVVAQSAPVVPPAAPAKAPTFGEVYFGPNESIVLAESSATVNAVADTLQGNPSIWIEVQGHTDARGSKARNASLSLERAQSVAQMLQTQGVERVRLVVTSFDSKCPAETLAKSRRVTFRPISSGVVDSRPGTRECP